MNCIKRSKEKLMLFKYLSCPKKIYCFSLANISSAQYKNCSACLCQRLRQICAYNDKKAWSLSLSCFQSNEGWQTLKSSITLSSFTSKAKIPHAEDRGPCLAWNVNRSTSERGTLSGTLKDEQVGKRKATTCQPG